MSWNLVCVLLLACPQAAPEGKLLAKEKDHVGDFAFTPDGKAVVWQVIDVDPSGSDRILVYDLKSGKVAREFKTFRDPARAGAGSWRHLAVSPDSKLVAGSDDHPDCIQVWDLQTGALKLTLKSSAPDLTGLVAFTRDGKSILGTENRGPIHVWDAKTGKESSVIDMGGAWGNGTAFDLTVSPDSKLVAVATGYALICDLESSTYKFTLRDESSQTSGSGGALSFSPDSKRLAVARTKYGADTENKDARSTSRSIEMWDLGTQTRLYTVAEPVKVIGLAHTVAFSPDGKILAGFMGRMDLKFWDPDTGKELGGFPVKFLDRIAWSPDGRSMAVMTHGPDGLSLYPEKALPLKKK